MKDLVLSFNIAFVAWFCINIVVVTILWSTQSWRQNWSLPSTLSSVAIRFWATFSVAFVGFLEHSYSQDKDIYTFLFCKALFVSFLYGTTISSRLIISDVIFKNEQPFTKRTPEDKVTTSQITISVLITISQYVAMQWVYWRYLKWPVHFSFKIGYFENMVVMSVTEIMADVAYGLFHHLLLHGPLWFTHKLHHGIYRPTIMLGRYFDALDWFIEYHVPEFISIWFLHVWYGDNGINILTLYLLFAESWGISQEHHCGKWLPFDTTQVYPFVQSLVIAPIIGFESCTLVHETHHNLLKCNYSLAGFYDLFAGTLKDVSKLQNIYVDINGKKKQQTTKKES